MEDVSSCGLVQMLNLGPGCTAPPPTPVRSRLGLADTAPSVASPFFEQNDDDAFWMSAPVSTPTCVDFVEGDDSLGCIPFGTISRNSTPPSRADLDELAVFLTQQSLISTPTLLASPSFRRKREMSSRSDPPQRQNSLVDGSRCSAATYSYSSDGFCEESKAAIQRTCEVEGAFYVQVTDMHKAYLSRIHDAFKQHHSKNKMCLIVTCPDIAFCELMTSLNAESSTAPCRPPQDKTGFEFSLVPDADFRESLTMFASLLTETSRGLLKLLLGEVCSEKMNTLMGQFMKPILYCYRANEQESHISKCDEDLVLSIISHEDPNCEDSKGELLLVVLGNCLQSLSQGKFRPPSTVSSFDNLGDQGYGFRLDLKYYL